MAWEVLFLQQIYFVVFIELFLYKPEFG